ncbi:hypothetical protein KR009_010904, partial [Drosophila setifemur]
KMFAGFLLCLCLAGLVRPEAVPPTPLRSLSSKDFQLEFLRDLANFAESQAEQSLNDYLEQLERNPGNADHMQELTGTRSSSKFLPKVTLIKQVMDAQPHLDTDLEHISVLRNLVFLNRLKATLRAARDTSAQEIRQLRIHRLCQQFDRPSPPRRSGLINDQTVGAALEQLNLTQRGEGNTTGLDLNQFGMQLYERVKLSGAEIIDNYLQILRGLIQDIMDKEHPDLVESSSQLEKMVQHLDEMLSTRDFFAKRQKVYAYLERHLTADYEQLREPESSELHLTEQLLAQLKAKGLDLFVIFLFSNFEFLEQVHQHWTQLLPQSPSLLYDENARQLYDIQQLYENFMLDTESEAKYQAYSSALKRLHERTVEQGERSSHIFEMLNNAAQNVGSITFNMIKGKCQELI